MTIEIQRPELEALIGEWMKTGAFQSVEDVLIRALKSSSPPASQKTSHELAGVRSGAELVEAMQASPFKEISLDSDGVRMPVRDVVF